VCQAGPIIQAIGNIWTIFRDINHIDPEGRVTATHSQGPKTKNAGWRGTLDLFACLDDPKIAYYTLSYRRPHETAKWTDIDEKYPHPRYDGLSDPAYEGSKVGPFFDRGNDLAARPCYLNIEGDPAWVATHRHRKLQLKSSLYEAGSADAQRTVEIKIDGYDSAGKRIAEASDQIALFIDNRPVTGEIDTLTLGTPPLDDLPPGECGMFKLASDTDPIQVRFRAHQPGGLLDGYSLKVLRGSNTPVPVQDDGDPHRAAWRFDPVVHGVEFFGTADLPSSNGDGFVTAELTPTGSWLGSFQSCAFAFELHSSGVPKDYPGRRTNGYSNGGGGRLDVELVCIER
jgi:hypothetical protein